MSSAMTKIPTMWIAPKCFNTACVCVCEFCPVVKHLVDGRSSACLATTFPHFALCRIMFPRGLPSKFVFVSTFRMSSRARKDVWNLVRVDDSRMEPQFSVKLDGQRKVVDLVLRDYLQQAQMFSFPSQKVTYTTVLLLCWHSLSQVKLSRRLGITPLPPIANVLAPQTCVLPMRSPRVCISMQGKRVTFRRHRGLKG